MVPDSGHAAGPENNQIAVAPALPESDGLVATIVFLRTKWYALCPLFRTDKADPKRVLTVSIATRNPPFQDKTPIITRTVDMNAYYLLPPASDGAAPYQRGFAHDGDAGHSAWPDLVKYRW